MDRGLCHSATADRDAEACDDDDVSAAAGQCDLGRDQCGDDDLVGSACVDVVFPQLVVSAGKRHKMNPIIELLVYTAFAGAAIPIGGFLASIERIHPEWLEAEFRHTVIAFGGGALISAVALVNRDGTRQSIVNNEYLHRRSAEILERIEITSRDQLSDLLRERFGIELPLPADVFVLVRQLQ